MKNIEFFKNIGIGQYIDRDSFIHRMSPLSKYLMLLALVAIVVGAPSPAGAAMGGAMAILLALASKIQPGFLLRSLKPLVPVFVLSGAMQLLFRWPGDSSRVFFRFGFLDFTLREAWIVALILLRSTGMIISIGWFTSVTTESDSARGIEELFSRRGAKQASRLLEENTSADVGAAKSGGSLPHRIALASAMAIRFVPIVAGELEEIVKAQASRGADFGSGRKGVIAKARAYLPLFVPVTVRALERAELLAEAMEARCYTGEGRTPPPERVGAARDLAIGFAALAAAAGLILADALVLSVRIRPF